MLKPPRNARHPSFDATWVPQPQPQQPAQPGGANGTKSEYCYVDVHWSSGPANRAFWLMSKGLGCGGGGKPAALGEGRGCTEGCRSRRPAGQSRQRVDRRARGTWCAPSTPRLLIDCGRHAPLRQAHQLAGRTAQSRPSQSVPGLTPRPPTPPDPQASARPATCGTVRSRRTSPPSPITTRPAPPQCAPRATSSPAPRRTRSRRRGTRSARRAARTAPAPPASRTSLRTAPRAAYRRAQARTAPRVARVAARSRAGANGLPRRACVRTAGGWFESRGDSFQAAAAPGRGSGGGAARPCKTGRAPL